MVHFQGTEYEARIQEALTSEADMRTQLEAAQDESDQLKMQVSKLTHQIEELNQQVASIRSESEAYISGETQLAAKPMRSTGLGLPPQLATQQPDLQTVATAVTCTIDLYLECPLLVGFVCASPYCILPCMLLYIVWIT